jgi:hypothetical protein
VVPPEWKAGPLEPCCGCSVAAAGHAVCFPCALTVTSGLLLVWPPPLVVVWIAAARLHVPDDSADQGDPSRLSEDVDVAAERARVLGRDGPDGQLAAPAIVIKNLHKVCVGGGGHWGLRRGAVYSD